MFTSFLSYPYAKSFRIQLCAVAIFFIGSIPFIRTRIDQFRTFALTKTDQLMVQPQKRIRSISELLSHTTQQSQSIERIEQQNRQLFAQIASYQAQIKTASQSSIVLTERHSQSALSFSGGQWIVLVGAASGVRESDIVLLDGVVLGVISTVYPNYSRVQTIQSATFPTLVMHGPTKSPGVLATEKSLLSVQFSKKIETIAVGDLILTVPDGEHTRNSYAVATVHSVTNQPTDSVSSVRVTPLAQPLIGATVQVVLTN